VPLSSQAVATLRELKPGHGFRAMARTILDEVLGGLPRQAQERRRHDSDSQGTLTPVCSESQIPGTQQKSAVAFGQWSN
jgi:hypothetical protein